MTNLELMRRALAALGDGEVDKLTDNQVSARVSVTISALATFVRALISGLRLPPAGAARLLRATAAVLELGEEDAVEHILAELAGAEPPA